MSQYILKEKLLFSHKGEMEEAQFIELSAPSSRHIPNLAPVRAEVLKALQWASSQNDDEVEVVDSENLPEKEGEIDQQSSDMVMTTLELAPKINVSSVILHVSRMLIGKGGLALVDGESRFTQGLYDDLSIKDVYGLTGFFIANFIIPSL